MGYDYAALDQDVGSSDGAVQLHDVAVHLELHRRKHVHETLGLSHVELAQSGVEVLL